MAKKTNGDGQPWLPGFEPSPAIRNFGLTSVKLGTGVVTGDFAAATEATDLAMLTPERWAEAHAAQLVKLCGGDWLRAHHLLLVAHGEFEAEREARAAVAGGTVVEFRGARDASDGGAEAAREGAGTDGKPPRGKGNGAGAGA
jgi:hypothetical protein